MPLPSSGQKTQSTLRWKQEVPLKYWYIFSKPHSFTSKLFIVTSILSKYWIQKSLTNVNINEWKACTKYLWSFKWKLHILVGFMLYITSADNFFVWCLIWSSHSGNCDVTSQFVRSVLMLKGSMHMHIHHHGTPMVPWNVNALLPECMCITPQL